MAVLLNLFRFREIGGWQAGGGIVGEPLFQELSVARGRN